jgi:hypothetical protein
VERKNFIQTLAFLWSELQVAQQCLRKTFVESQVPAKAPDVNSPVGESSFMHINNTIEEPNTSPKTCFNKRLSSKLAIEYPDFTTLPEPVKEKYESLPTVVNIFRMLGYSSGTFVEILDLTNAIFKKLKLSDYHKELLVLQVAAHEGNSYEWEQHVSISQAAGVREDQFIAIAEQRFDDGEALVPRERVLLNFGKIILQKGKAPGVVFKHALEHFSIQELSDAMIVIGYYRLLSSYIQTFNVAIDAQEEAQVIAGWLETGAMFQNGQQRPPWRFCLKI